jgi:hypothetical protein
MDTKKILAGVLIFILLIMLFNLLNKHTITVTTTKAVIKQPNKYVVHTKPVYYPHYNPYKAQYYN